MRHRVATQPDAALVSSELAGALDRAVRGLWGASWGEARAWIASGKVCVDGEVVTRPTARVLAGQELAFHARARRPRPFELADEAVVHVDPHVVVVSKPPGLNTVPYVGKGPSDSPAGAEGADVAERPLDALVRAWLGRKSKAKNVRPTLGVVHRLDRETSGLIVFTRTWLAKQSLAAQFRVHSVHRRYLAIAGGEVRPATIRTFLLDDRGDGRRGSARGRPPPGAREAVTHVEPLERLPGATLVACRLETGRTHQIRVHLAEAGNPVLGERVYGARSGRFDARSLEAPRLMLHAAELGFLHPSTGRAMRWDLPMPADMLAVLERLRR